MHQTLRWMRQESHQWIILLAVLALPIVFLIETFITPKTSVEAVSTPVPVFSLSGGYYERDIQLKISAPGPGLGKKSNVIFTTDGSEPTHSTGTVFTQPIHLSAATPGVTVIRARVVLPDDTLGPVVSRSYFVGVQATLPMVSLVVDPGDLWDQAHGIYANPHERGSAWERPVDVTFVDKDRRSGFHISAGIRIHGGAGRGSGKESFRLYFRQEYGASRLDYPLFVGSAVQSFKRLVLHTSGQDWHSYPHTNWTLMRNQLADRLALQLNGYATHSQPALVFINGEPWGLYHIRERLDEHFLADHFGIQQADFLEAPDAIGRSNIIMGDREHWDHLLQFVETHDIADPANYAYVQSQVDVANFVDYNILQIYAANTDWPDNNVNQFRPRVQGGRWHWVFWDSDYSFGATWVSRADTNMMERLLDYDHPQTGGRDVLLLRKLLENPAFLERFLSRTADLLNGTLAPLSVISHIDALAAEMGPDMEYETARWSSLTNMDTVATGLGLDIADETVRWQSPVRWESNVEELRDFARRRPDFVRQHLVERFELRGTGVLSVSRPVGGKGVVAVNGSLVENLPWQGTFFLDIPVQITAVPGPGFRFAGWDPPHLPQEPVIAVSLDAALEIKPRFVPAKEGAPHPGDVIFRQYPEDAYGDPRQDRIELMVTRSGGIDLRGWRVTDNDTKTATDEGSLIFRDIPAFARVPQNASIVVIVTQSGAGPVPADDLSTWDGQMVLYAGNGNLDAESDPGFRLGPNDNLALLAPGPTAALADDQGIAFVANNTAVTPASFGILTDGVQPTQ